MVGMRLLDLFCGAGGAAMGYHRAGFEDITGVDNKPQPNYPFEFVQQDALDYLHFNGDRYDFIHASPPCQAYSRTKSMPNVGKHPALIDSLREILQAIGHPYVIENVPGAPLHNPIILCGIMFGLQVFRHRLLETKPWMLGPPHIKHPADAVTNSHRGYSSFENGATHITCAGQNFKREDGAKAMNIDWMARPELAQAIPPAYTEFIGKRIMEMERENS